MGDGSIDNIPQAKADRLHIRYALLTIPLVALTSVTAILPVYRDRLQAHFTITNTEFGVLLTLGLITSTVGALIGGALVDRRGPRAVLRICLIGNAAGLALAACPGRWTLMLAAMCVACMFYGPLTIAVQSYLVALFPHNRRRVLTLNLTLMSIGGVVFPLLAESLLELEKETSAVSFRQILHGPFAVTAAVLLLGALLLYRRGHSPVQAPLPHEPVGRGPRRGPQSRCTGFGDPARPSASAVLLVSLMVIHGAADMASYNWMPKVLGGASFDRVILPPGVVLAGFSLAYVVSRGLMSALPEHFGIRTMLIAPGILGGGFFAAGLLSRDQFWASAGYLMGAFCWSVEYPAMLACLAAERERFGSTLAVGSAFTNLVSFGVAVLMGYIGDRLAPESFWLIELIPAAMFPLVSLGAAIYVWRFGVPGRQTGSPIPIHRDWGPPSPSA